MTTHTKLHIVVLLLIIVGGTIWYQRTSETYAESVGELRLEQDATLKTNIEKYMETETNTPDTQGTENYRCSSLVYGWDDQYAYAWVSCAGYTSGIEGSVTLASASSVPTRLEYQGPKFSIVGFEQPGDGNLYEPSLKKLFPKKIFDLGHPTNEQLGELEANTLVKARAYARPNELSSFMDDLNGDGELESVTMLISDSYDLGRVATLRVGESVVTLPGGNPNEFTVVDIDTKDNLKEIAASDSGPSGDYTTSFYTWNGTDLTFMGTIPGMDDQVEYDGNGTITTTKRASVLDTWFYRDSYKLLSDHSLVRVPKDFFERIDQGMPITLLAPLTVQMSPTDSTDATTLEIGNVVTILGCDDVEWCEIKTEDGITGWFALENFDVIKGTGLEARNFFNGLSYAD